MPLPTSTIRMIFLGDSQTGKSSIGVLLSSHTFIQEYVPTEGYQVFTRKITGTSLTTRESVRIVMYEIGSTEEIARYKKHLPDGVDLLCYFYNTQKDNSLNNLETVWLPQVNNAKEWLLKFEPRAVLIGIGPHQSFDNKKLLSIQQSIHAYKNIFLELDIKAVEQVFISLVDDYFSYKEDKKKIPSNFADLF